MTSTVKLISRGVLTAASVAQYTSPVDGLDTVITNIIITNTSTSNSRTATVTLNGTPLLSAIPVSPSSVAVFDLRQVLPAGQVLAALASVTDDLYLHVSGVEMT